MVETDSDPKFQSEIVLVAPVHAQARYAVFSAKPGTGTRPVVLTRVVTDSLTPEQERLKISYPVGAGNINSYNSANSLTPPWLRNMTIIDSRKAGASRSADIYFSLLSPLLHELGIGHVYVATDSSETIKEHARSFSTSSTVVLIGGDTSLHEFVNALPYNRNQEEMRLIVIPTGTGNALLNSMGVHRPLQAVRQLFHQRNFSALSTFKVEFPHMQPIYSLMVASYGLHSAIVADSDSEDLRKLGNERFKIAARENIETPQVYRGKVTLDGKVISETHSYILATLVKQLEPGFTISPNSRSPSGETLYLVHIPVISGEELMNIMKAVFHDSGHLKDPRVTYTTVKSSLTVDVEGQEERFRRWCIDGTIVVAPPGRVILHPASHECNGWKLMILDSNCST